MSGRIERRFAELAQAGRTGLVPFFTCGDPSLDAAAPIMHALVEAGADVLELGVPFSDPQADGPVIQRSSSSPTGSPAASESAAHRSSPDALPSAWRRM